MDANDGKWVRNPVTQEKHVNHPESNDQARPLNLPTRTQNASWHIPAGVTKSNWEYAQAKHIATGYDDFLQGDPLTAIDRRILTRYFPDVRDGGPESGCHRGPIVADFGCGNGRTLDPLLRRGYRGVGVDLSIPMLTAFAEKGSDLVAVRPGASNQGGLLLLQANLVELDGIGDQTIDHGISLFSTLGMIQGARHRAEFLKHVRRLIKPGGMFILHAHNAWFQIRHPGGIRWAFWSALSHLRGKAEFGDRTANYRSISQMFIHSFRRRELAGALRAAGFSETKWFGILPGVDSELERLPMGSSVRLVGWIVVCR